MNITRSFDEARFAFAGEDEIALDLETSGLSPWKSKIAVIAMYGAQSDTAAVLHYPDGNVPQNVLDWIAKFPKIVGHNLLNFDLHFLAIAGMDWSHQQIFDTMLGEMVVVATNRRDVRKNLADTTKRRLGKVLDKSIDHSAWTRPELTPEAMLYVTGDIKYLLDLRKAQEERASEFESVQRALAFEMELGPIMVQIGQNGFPLSLDELKKYRVINEDRAKSVIEELQKELGITMLTSVPKVKAALQKRFGAKMFPDTKAERLQEYVIYGGDIGRVCEKLKYFREANQRKNMLSDKWVWDNVVQHDGYTAVHGRFWQCSTATGRMSGSDPNLQQVPKDARHIYGHRPGWAVGKIDYAQIEVRVAAALAGDMVMIEAINSGLDVHTFVASMAFGIPMEEVTRDQRQIAKAMNFLLLFGGGKEGLWDYAHSSGSLVPKNEIEIAFDRYFTRFKGINRMRQAAIAQADSGRPRVIVYPTGLRRVVAGWELKATTLLNNSVQGTAAAGLKKGIIIAHEKGVSKYISAVVHDEVVVCAPRDIIRDVIREVEDAMILGMKWALSDCEPISIGVESTWGDTWKGDDANEQKRESGV